MGRRESWWGSVLNQRREEGGFSPGPVDADGERARPPGSTGGHVFHTPPFRTLPGLWGPFAGESEHPGRETSPSSSTRTTPGLQPPPGVLG